jgi:hypothetical protein
MPYQGNNPSAYEPGPSIGESQGFAGGLSAIGTSALDVLPSRTTTKVDTNKQTILDQNAIDQLIYQALSGNGGISAIRTGEASSGGYGSSAAALQSADLIAAVAGQIGEMTGPKVNQSETTTKKKKSVICTVLAKHGLLNRIAYEMGQEQFRTLDSNIIDGYHSWAYWVADRIPSNKIITRIALYIAIRRYRYVLFHRKSFIGWLSVRVGEPICALIGSYGRKPIYS